MNTKVLEKLSLLIPVHNEEANLEWHHNKITKELTSLNINYEIVYVNDGSEDSSIDILRKICKTTKNTHYVSLSRNFGKEAAITAGMKKVSGQAVMILDADGQHPIEMLPNFIDKWKDGYQIVTGIRQSNQGEGVIKSLGSRLFYSLLHIVDSREESIPGSTDFRLIDRKVIDEFNLLTERNRVARNLIDWLGFKKAYIPFDAEARHAGVASYSYTKLIKLAIDGAITHSTRPLKLIGALGLIISLVSTVLMILILCEMYILNDPLNLAISGTAILGVFLSFLVGIVLTCQGLLALYLENVYHETRNRPLYIVDEEN